MERLGRLQVSLDQHVVNGEVEEVLVDGEWHLDGLITGMGVELVVHVQDQLGSAIFSTDDGVAGLEIGDDDVEGHVPLGMSAAHGQQVRSAHRARREMVAVVSGGPAGLGSALLALIKGEHPVVREHRVEATGHSGIVDGTGWEGAADVVHDAASVA